MQTYFLRRLVWHMKVWRDDLTGYVLETFLSRFFGSRDWSQSSHETTALLLNAFRSILANLANE